jgi:uncharacterized protein (UPF0210 family)
MKIRTITVGFNYKETTFEKDIGEISKFLDYSKKVFQKNNYYVQTIRISTQSWDDFLKSEKQIIRLVKDFENYSKKYNIDYFNIGPTFKNKNISLIYDIIKNTDIGFCTAYLSDGNKINFEGIKKTSRLIKKISEIDSDGFSNLRFAAIFNMKPGCPFYPSSYHKGDNKIFSIGLENSDLVYNAFSQAKTIEKAGFFLNKILNNELVKIDQLCKKISKNTSVRYGGIDPSISPSVNPSESIAFAFEKLGIDRFGDSGTISISKIITDTLNNLKIKKCGYCGLMLPVLEDYGLSKRNNERSFNITNLLTYSTVCGIGLDTIPLPGDISENKLYRLLVDIASLSNKLNKPLSARLMPVPNKNIGEITNYKFSYFENTNIMDI